MRTTSVFPVVPGTEVKLTCETGYTLEGDDVIICVKGTNYAFDNEPGCNMGKMFYLFFNNLLKDVSLYLI